MMLLLEFLWCIVNVLGIALCLLVTIALFMIVFTPIFEIACCIQKRDKNGMWNGPPSCIFKDIYNRCKNGGS
jgi:hypothetical protein